MCAHKNRESSTEMDEFLHIWQTKCFQFENGANEADHKRFQIAQLQLLKSINNESGANDIALTQKMTECLFEYGRIVDNRNGINNYAAPIMALVGNSKNDSKQWKSNLDVDDVIEKYLKSNEVPCDEFKLEYSKLSNFMNKSKRKFNTETKHNPSNVRYEKTLPQISTTILEQVKIWPNMSSDTSVVGVASRQTDGYVKGTESDWHYKDQPQNLCHTSTAFGGSAQEDSNQWNFVPKRSYPQTTQTVPQKPNSCFKTAAQQLVIDEHKKFGQGSGTVASTSYGSDRRCLGTRRGVSGKFVPPVKQEDEDMIGCGAVVNSCMMKTNKTLKEDNQYEDLMKDENLKNIEPKMVQLIMDEIFNRETGVTWKNIAGLEIAKSTIQEIVVWPMLRPDIFTGLRSPPKGILLFGPPGTGKTMIGKCIARESGSTFFCISASSLTSKWIGEGEKMVRALFAVARCHQPAVIFIDEIDSLLSQRNETEHESSRRMKTEFLVQLDGVACANADRLLVVGATNRPHELDEAARRRLVKRIYIPLPEAQAREQIIVDLLTKFSHSLTPADIEHICSLTEGYSGADMHNLCKDASYGPIRDIFEKYGDITLIAPDQVQAICVNDFIASLNTIRASVSEQDLFLYEQWNEKFGITPRLK